MKKRLLMLALSAVVLALLWRRTGLDAMGDTLSQVDGAWLAGALALFVPQTLLSAVRWRWIVGFYQPLSFGISCAKVQGNPSCIAPVAS